MEIPEKLRSRYALVPHLRETGERHVLVYQKDTAREKRVVVSKSPGALVAVYREAVARERGWPLPIVRQLLGRVVLPPPWLSEVYADSRYRIDLGCFQDHVARLARDFWDVNGYPPPGLKQCPVYAPPEDWEEDDYSASNHLSCTSCNGAKWLPKWETWGDYFARKGAEFLDKTRVQTSEPFPGEAARPDLPVTAVMGGDWASGVSSDDYFAGENPYITERPLFFFQGAEVDVHPDVLKLARKAETERDAEATRAVQAEEDYPAKVKAERAAAANKFFEEE